MRKLLLLLLLVTGLVLNAQNLKDLVIGKVHTIQSGALNESRTLNVYLPQSYDRAKSYPVLYVLDGSMHEDFIHVVGLVQYFNLQFKMPDFIVVGIENVDRKRDFTFHTELIDLREKYSTTGHSDNFINFLETELIPYIETNYKTNGTKYLTGQSLGGLLATEILLKKPQLFTHYLITSPSLWWDNESMLENADKLLEAQTVKPEYVYVAVGAGEAPIMRKEAEAIYKKLKKAKYPKTDFIEMKEENHATILHNSLYKAFSLLYPYKEE